jgi:spermidine synthase
MVGIARGWFFLLFAVSGFSGLIYESLWSHYLKLFLGHAAYAQSLVLAILMGGMAIGAWACGRLAHRWRNLLVGYAIAEAAVGIFALWFHKLFVGATGFAYDVAIPGLGSPLAADAFRWLLAAALILPQSVLLGATFPLMSAGILRAYPGRDGSAIATLYFSNSLGAGLGVLASGFILVEAIGLPGTMLAAGLVNVGLAAIVWLLGRGMPQPVPAAAPSFTARTLPQGYRLMLAVSLLTGMASFMYEIGWIRMLSMVLGSSTQAFELMLSAFLFGLAFGGLWIRRRIDAAASPETWLGMIQVAMGACALATLLVYGRTFELMQVLLLSTGRTDGGYAAFNLGSHAIALLVMFPAAFCAGMTLPLITRILLLRGGGERAIGAVYSANTVGAIAGVVVATHLAMPLLGLKGLITLGAALDIGLGLVLLWRHAGGRLAPAATFLAGVALVGTIAGVELDTLKMASGVYRYGELLRRGDAEVLLHRDGKTATVNLLRDRGRLAIVTNGKADAMMDVSPGAAVGDDEPVMAMLGALPLLLQPQARSAAVVGFGSGITSHVLLASSSLRELDTIEIEAAMVEAAARGFRPLNSAAFDDPRSRVHIEDAKAFFARQGKRYDLIVSEPSNPWVSGVASLFTHEFYRRVATHLNPDGLFVQWLQLYEMEVALVASVMKALVTVFPHYDIYSADDNNLIVVARRGAAVPLAGAEAFRQPGLAQVLARLQVRGPADLEHFRLGDRKLLQPFFERYAISANSDYHPVLDQNAARARFLGLSANEIVRIGSMQLPAGDFLGSAPMAQAQRRGSSGAADAGLSARWRAAQPGRPAARGAHRGAVAAPRDGGVRRA